MIRLTDCAAQTCAPQPLRIKRDPGSKTTGLTVVRDVPLANAESSEMCIGAAVLSLIDVVHCGRQISEVLKACCGRRSHNRALRFLNRTKPKGWLPHCSTA